MNFKNLVNASLISALVAGGCGGENGPDLDDTKALQDAPSATSPENSGMDKPALPETQENGNCAHISGDVIQKIYGTLNNANAIMIDPASFRYGWGEYQNPHTFFADSPLVQKMNMETSDSEIPYVDYESTTLHDQTSPTDYLDAEDNIRIQVGPMVQPSNLLFSNHFF